MASAVRQPSLVIFIISSHFPPPYSLNTFPSTNTLIYMYIDTLLLSICKILICIYTHIHIITHRIRASTTAWISI